MCGRVGLVTKPFQQGVAAQGNANRKEWAITRMVGEAAENPIDLRGVTRVIGPRQAIRDPAATAKMRYRTSPAQRRERDHERSRVVTPRSPLESMEKDHQGTRTPRCSGPMLRRFALARGLVIEPIDDNPVVIGRGPFRAIIAWPRTLHPDRSIDGLGIAARQPPRRPIGPDQWSVLGASPRDSRTFTSDTAAGAGDA